MFSRDMGKERFMIEKMHFWAGIIVASEVTLAMGLFWAIETHVV